MSCCSIDSFRNIGRDAFPGGAARLQIWQGPSVGSWWVRLPLFSANYFSQPGYEPVLCAPTLYFIAVFISHYIRSPCCFDKLSTEYSVPVEGSNRVQIGLRYLSPNGMIVTKYVSLDSAIRLCLLSTAIYLARTSVLPPARYLPPAW